MSQNRKPPAYQEYAAEFLSNRVFRLLTLTQRGLLQTMRLECWVNHQVPAQPAELAKYLGLNFEEVRSGLSDGVKSFFVERGDSYICPELEDYRQHLADRKSKQSIGGMNGAAITNRKRNLSATTMNVGDSSPPSTKARLSRRGSDEPLVKSSTEQLSQNQSLENGVVDNSFVKDIEAAERRMSKDYEKASRGE